MMALHCQRVARGFQRPEGSKSFIFGIAVQESSRGFAEQMPCGETFYHLREHKLRYPAELLEGGCIWCHRAVSAALR